MLEGEAVATVEPVAADAQLELLARARTVELDLGAAAALILGTAIALVLALYAFQALPVNFAGLALLILGIGFMVLEAFVPSFGALGIGGVIAFTAGSVMLFREDAGEIGVGLPVIITFVVLSAALFIGMIGFAVKNRHQPVVSGAEEMVGAYGEALEDFDRRGRIRVQSTVGKGTAFTIKLPACRKAAAPVAAPASSPQTSVPDRPAMS